MFQQPSFALLATASAITLALSITAAEPPFLHAPSVDTYATHDPMGRTILSNGRYLTPAGRHFPVPRDP